MVGTTLNKETYAITSASTGAMDIPFRYDDNSWIYAVAFSGESETTTTLVLGSDFTLAGDGTQSLGEITLSESFLENLVPSTLVVYRIAPALQTLDLQLNTRLPAEALESALDRLAMASIDRSNTLQRTFTLPYSDPESFASSYAIEGANDRKGTVMAFSSLDGRPFRQNYSDLATVILQYIDLGDVGPEVLAAISALSPIRLFVPPTVNTPAKFGQLAIIPASSSVIMTPPGFDPVTLHEVSYNEFVTLTGIATPDSSYPFYALKESGYEFAHCIYPLESVPNWQAVYYDSPSGFPSISSSSDFPAVPYLANWADAPFNITVTEGPFIPARVWVNVSITGQSPDWREILSEEQMDLRYGLETVLRVTTTQTVTNSATLTDSTVLQRNLAVGTYEFESLELIGSSAYATAGAKASLVFTGTGTFTGIRQRSSASNVEPINMAPTWVGTGESVNGQASVTDSSLMITRDGRLTVTAQGVLKIQFAQNTAIASNTAGLLSGSYLKIRKTS